MRANRILALLAPTLLFWSAAFAASPVQKREIKETRATYALDVAYPRTGHAAIDTVLETWAKGVARDFLEMAKDATVDPAPWSGELSYDVVRNDAAMIVVAFTWYTYTGGAHPNSTFETFNFLLPDGAHVELAELFTAKGVARISDISIARLKQTLGGPDAMSDIDWIKRGAGPNARNFSAFQLLPRDLVIAFDAYQVAAYAAGPQEVRIPLAQLRDVMRPDPRAPAASFECALARADVEQAICSSRELARLDRHVAEAYGDKLMWASDEAKRAAIREEQRAWLKRRDALCLRTGRPLVACLTGAYQQRLRALQGGS
jgi:uncharacterized protein YecT (DUF1311 family)